MCYMATATKTRRSILFCILATAYVTLERLPGAAAANLVWPLPLNHSSTGRQLVFSHPKRLKFYAEGKYSSILEEAFGRYRELLLDAYPAPVEDDDSNYKNYSFDRRHLSSLLSSQSSHDLITSVSVFVVSSDQSLGIQASETYTLRIGPETIIHATTVFGALRALETLSQLARSVPVDGSLLATLPGPLVDALTGGDDDSSDPNVKFSDSESDSDSEGENEDDDDFNAVGRKHHHGHHKKHHKHHHRHHKSDERRIIVITEAAIYDTPRFRHRGLLIDTARHFLPVPLIKAHLDAMAATKLNVLHWHIIDDQSFPYKSDALPELAREGAFSPDAVYTSDDIDDIVTFARARGIRVVPEFDSPGHAAAWGKSHPEIMSNCGEEGQAAAPMDPSKEGTYTLLWLLLREASRRFPDAFVHIGGDEVDLECWRSDPDVKAWMSEQGMRSAEQALAYHTHRVVKLAEAAGKKVIAWQEAVDGPGGSELLPESAVVQVWKWSKDLGNRLSALARRSAMELQPSSADLNPNESSPDEFWLSELERVTSAGHLAVLSAPWYLNLAPGGDDHTWQRYWEVEPLNFKGSLDQKERVIGGEACVWGEVVDATNALQKTWPLAAAVGERLWSDESVRDAEDARQRLEAFRCLLLWRGIPAEPVGPGICHPDVEARVSGV